MPHPDLADRVMRQRDVIPPHRLPFLISTTTQDSFNPSLLARAHHASATPATSGPKPTSQLTTTVLPVVLGAGVPVLCAIVVLIFLHRRHVKRLLREDANDKHKSLDFGMDLVGPSSHRKGPMNGMPQMMQPSHTKGLSLDVHPYLLPPGLHGSGDSLHSLSRSIDDDKYHPAVFRTHDNGSVRSASRARDDTSSRAVSQFGATEEPKSGLLQNAQRMSRSSPPLYQSSSNESIPQPQPPPPVARPDQEYRGPLPDVTPSRLEHSDRDLTSGRSTPDSKASERAAPSPEPQFPLPSEASLHFGIGDHTDSIGNANTSYESHEDRPNFPLPDPEPSQAEPSTQTSTMQLPRISLPSSDIASDYGDDRKSEFMIPAVNIHSVDDAEHYDGSNGNGNHLPEFPEELQNLDPAFENRRDTRRLTLGVRPLPPEDPADNPEQRANRIRSFYKEYFDESKRETTYFEDYGSEFYESGYIYDPVTGDYYDAAPAPPAAPFAEPMGRRAMTPPPRAPPRFQGAARHMATNSAGFNGFAPGPRAFSSASGRLPGPRGPRKPIPPPAPLQELPTPHMLRDDAIMMAADFAPGKNFRDQREGRPDTPTGGMRPYSPALRAHTPLASAFDELAAIPSPHALRKSGTYTTLDFAPPPRFKTSDTASDAGSIRSNRTGISTTHMNNIRMGNYRVSRLPGDMVGTKDDLLTSLRPNWDMNR